MLGNNSCSLEVTVVTTAQKKKGLWLKAGPNCTAEPNCTFPEPSGIIAVIDGN